MCPEKNLSGKYDLHFTFDWKKKKKKPISTFEIKLLNNNNNEKEKNDETEFVENVSD